jgi:hypothetical protein
MPSAPQAQAPSARRRRFYVPVPTGPGTRRMHIRRAVIPRQAAKATSDSLAKMFTELRMVADPLRRDVAKPVRVRRQSPTRTFRCAECNERFEASNTLAKFCGVRCRVRAWRV